MFEQWLNQLKIDIRRIDDNLSMMDNYSVDRQKERVQHLKEIFNKFKLSFELFDWITFMEKPVPSTYKG